MCFRITSQIDFIMPTYNWYQLLKKPAWAPPSFVFGPVWTILYAIIAISFGYVGYLAYQKRISLFTTVPFILNLIFNILFTPIQFGLKNNVLASIDIILVLTTLVWAMVSIFPHVRWVALVNIPYLLWVCFATVLQLTITYLNKS